jgi:3-phenylpropionate/trans-cinnamate dioxygenase ferredoxin subunit
VTSPGGFVAAGPADLAIGSAEMRRIGERDILLARAQDGQFHAVAPICSHALLTLQGGRVRGSSIVCPHHGARFCLRTGRALGLPAVAGIVAYPTRVVGNRIEIWPL